MAICFRQVGFMVVFPNELNWCILYHSAFKICNLWYLLPLLFCYLPRWARTGSHKGPSPTSTSSPAPTIHGLNGQIRRRVVARPVSSLHPSPYLNCSGHKGCHYIPPYNKTNRGVKKRQKHQRVLFLRCTLT